MGKFLKRSYLSSYIFYLLFFCSQVQADAGLESGNVQPNTSWMAGKIGLSTHYFASSPDGLEQRAPQLKIDEIANQAANAGATWFLFTLYHHPWLMMSPNETYDRILGVNNFTSTRDVPLELSNVLRRKNIRLML